VSAVDIVLVSNYCFAFHEN